MVRDATPAYLPEGPSGLTLGRTRFAWVDGSRIMFRLLRTFEPGYRVLEEHSDVRAGANREVSRRLEPEPGSPGLCSLARMVDNSRASRQPGIPRRGLSACGRRTSSHDWLKAGCEATADENSAFRHFCRECRGEGQKSFGKRMRRPPPGRRGAAYVLYPCPRYQLPRLQTSSPADSLPHSLARFRLDCDLIQAFAAGDGGTRRRRQP